MEENKLTSNKINSMFIHLLRSAITQKKLDACYDISLEDSERLFKIAKAHDLAHLVGYAIDKNAINIEPKVAIAFQNEQFSAVGRYENSNYELNAICECFENAQIPFVPLKGSVIRDLYIEPWLRTSSDIDILVKKEDLERAIKSLITQLEYKKEGGSGHDVSLFSPSGVHLELHFELIDKESEVSNADKPLERVWEYVSVVEGKKYQMAMSEDMFYYYHVAHAAKHFILGGCGIRPLIDEYVLNCQQNIDEEGRLKLLKEGDLQKFEKHFKDLTNVWFDKNEYNATTRAMSNYLLEGGVYGNVTNLVTVGGIRKGGKFKYIMSRIWLPFKLLPESANPKSKKWLIPFYQMKRWLRVIFTGRGKRALNEIKFNAKGTSTAECSNLEQMIKELGFLTKK